MLSKLLLSLPIAAVVSSEDIFAEELPCEIDLPDNAEDLNLPPERVKIMEGVIYLPQINHDEILEAIEESANDCLSGRNQNHNINDDYQSEPEPRYFGDSPYNLSQGHNVIYMNNCFNQELEYYFNDILIDVFTTVRWLIRNGSSINDLHNQHPPYWLSSAEEIRNGRWNDPDYWSFSNRTLHWADMSTLVLCRGMQSRVIEFLSYESQSSIGWHIDAHADLTIGSLISDEHDFEGGHVEFEDYDEGKRTLYYRKGDAAIWSGWTNHIVHPLKSGLRKVFVNEFWTLPRNWDQTRYSAEDFLDKYGNDEHFQRAYQNTVRDIHVTRNRKPDNNGQDLCEF